MAAIPVTAFEPQPRLTRRTARFCFAKRDDTLDAALQRLSAL